MALRPDELRRVTEGLGREPTTVELYAFDAQWSEHCSYKSSRHLLKKLPTTGPNVVVGPGEDAGVVYLGEHEGDRYCVVVAHESHNHPSQVVPFEGAATGVGGIVRDVLCMGAEVIGLADCLRFGNVDDPNSHQRYVAQQVVDGIAAYGNAIGVPNIAGDAYFHEGFNDNCLVNVIALGLVKESEIIHSRAPDGSAGWDIVLVGKATDASGFGGASFSSLTLEEDNQEANKSAVQVPDPFLKNVIMRASYRVFEYLRERKITAGFKDLGAGGVMGCTAELCAAGGFGAIIDLDDVNVAIENLPPEVIAVGETQERLCWVLPGDVTTDVLRIYNEEFSLPEIARGARAVVIGAVQTEKRYVMRHGGEMVMDVPIDFLTGAVRQERESAPMDIERPLARFHEGTLQQRITDTLSNREVCSRRPLFMHYDTVVRGSTVLPRGTADAGVIAPIEGSRLGIALSVAGSPRLRWIDDYTGPSRLAQKSVIEALRKIIAVGARPICLTDCLNFGNPENPEHYWALMQCVDGLRVAAKNVELPFVSGNVSLYNEDRMGRSVPFSPIVSCIGVLDDVSCVLTPGFKNVGSSVYHVRLGSSSGGVYPSIKRLCQFMLECVGERLLLAAKATEISGILATVTQMSFASRESLGLEGVGAFGTAAASYLEFHDPTGWIVEVGDDRAFTEFAAERGLKPWELNLTPIGRTISEPVVVSEEYQLQDGSVSSPGRRVLIPDLFDAWSEPLESIFN